MAKSKPPFPGFGTPVPGYKLGGIFKTAKKGAKVAMKSMAGVAAIPDKAADKVAKHTVRGLKAWGKHIRENEAPYTERGKFYPTGGNNAQRKTRQKNAERDAMSPDERKYWELRDSAQNNTYRNDNWERFPKTYDEWKKQQSAKDKKDK